MYEGQTKEEVRSPSRKHEDTLTKVLQVLSTNPLLALEHAGSLDVREEQVVEAKVPKKLSREILENTPAPSRAVFVDLRTIPKKKSGYYFMAPYPKNPAWRAPPSRRT